MQIATWNVNSLKVRLPQVLDWLSTSAVDILALQELKMDQPHFPQADFAAAGWHAAWSGQKTFNGVAILARKPLGDIVTEFPDFPDPQRRLLAATVGDVRVVNVYCVNGEAVGSEKFTYKIQWFSALIRFLRAELARYPRLILLGDFNIAPDDRDVYDPVAWQGRILCSDTERAIFKKILDLGLYDSLRLLKQEAALYTWWDYRAAMFRRDLGMRIDHILISEALKSRCQDVWIDKAPRKNERPSDHTPIIARFS